MISNPGASVLLTLLAACSTGSVGGGQTTFTVPGIDGDVTATSLDPGATIEDCLELSIGGDSGFGDSTEAWCKDADGDGTFATDPTDPFADGCICIIAGTLPSEYVQVDETTTILGDCDDDDATVLSADTTVYSDGDGDGYGDDESEMLACGIEDGYTTTGGDCDDGDGDIYPDATEVCDDVDNNCDGDIDDADDDLVDSLGTWYQDDDEDGFGDDADSFTGCDQPEGWIEDNTDCDDSDAGINPGATEIADDMVDQDCDGVDEVTETSSPTEVCVTPISTTDTCSLYMSDLGTYPYTPDDPGWYPTAYATGIGELCAESPAVSGNDLKVNIECADSSDGSTYWGWELVDLNVSAMTIGGADVLSSVVSTEWDMDGDGDGDGADGIVTMPE